MKGSVCVSSGCNMWFVSSQLVVLSLRVFLSMCRNGREDHCSNTPGKFRNRKHATQPPQALTGER